MWKLIKGHFQDTKSNQSFLVLSRKLLYTSDSMKEWQNILLFYISALSREEKAKIIKSLNLYTHS